MPIYEYECQKCGERFEANQRISEPPLKKHEGEDGCGGKVVKLMSANTFHLKGTGWYKTDYAKSGSSTSSVAGKEKQAAPAPASEDKKEKAPKKETAAAGGD